MEQQQFDRVTRILLEAAALDADQLRRAQGEQVRSGAPLHQVLVTLGYVREQDAMNAMGKALGLPTVDLREVVPPEDLVTAIPAELAYRHQIIPLERTDSTLRVAVADPLNLEALDDVRLVTGLRVEPVLAERAEVQRLVQESYMAQVLAGEDDDVEVLEGEEMDVADLERMAREALVVRLVNMIFRQAVQERASDIHIEPFENDMIVRYRIDGVLHEVPAPAKRLLPAIVSRVKIMSELNIAEHRLPQDGRMGLLVSGREMDVRVSIIPTLHGESVSLRLLDQSSIMFELEELGFSQADLERWEDVIRRPYGIILATGPTGSGKTTTLYASMRRIFTSERNFITIEEPVEYRLDGVNQIDVRSKIGLTFASGLRSIVRHDPDVIMVGEIRDQETADIAIHAALTGHLVFSTLHTNDAPGAITRLLDMGVEPYLEASSIEGLLAQRLVRRICRRCKTEHEPSADRLETIERELGEAPPSRLWKGEGCVECRFTGYSGRTAIYELLVMSDDLRDMILRRASTGELRDQALREGMTGLRQDGWRKVVVGDTTIEEVIAATQADEE